MSNVIHPRTVANTNGPGPLRALMYKRNELPMKRNMAEMTVGPASMNRPEKMSIVLRS